MKSSSVTATLREQAATIYNTWLAGHLSTAKAMLSQIPHERTAYVVMTMTILAVNEGHQFKFSGFISEVTA